MNLWQRKPSQGSSRCSKDVVVGFAGGRSGRGGYCVREDDEEEEEGVHAEYSGLCSPNREKWRSHHIPIILPKTS